MSVAQEPGPREVEVLWLVWDCHQLAGAYPTPDQANAARTDLIERDVADFGPDPLWADTVTILRVTCATAALSTSRAPRTFHRALPQPEAPRVDFIVTGTLHDQPSPTI